MLIKCLRSEPEVFDPVEFKEGLNIITGERSETNNKTNGVGKSLLISCIDFCLLSDYKKSKISKVPEDSLSLTTDIILELSSFGNNIVIRRNIKQNDKPIIYVNGTAKPFSNLGDAQKFLRKCIFGEQTSLSLRQLLRVFKRAEKTGFNNIDDPDGEVRDLTPYLYLFNLDIDLHNIILKKAQDLMDAHKYNAELIKDIERLNITVKEAGAYANELKSQLETIDLAVESLSQHEVYETISDDISDLDNRLEKLSLRLVSIKEEIKNIDKVPEFQKISNDDILAVFNDCKKGLGDLIVREIDEIQEFKKIIDGFKIEVLSNRKNDLLSEKQKLVDDIRSLSKEYKNKTAVLDQSGNLRSFKVSLHEQELKKQEYNKISFLYEQHLQQEQRKLTLKADRGNALVDFEKDKEQKQDIISDFQDTVLSIHSYLYGNRKASFEIEVKEPKKYNQKTFVCFDMQTDDSGSARTEHEKVIIFDFSLLFCPSIRDRHIKTLIHDGAFEGVNEATKYQLMNWLHKKQTEEQEEFQYIVTINRDSFELLEKDNNFEFDLKQYVRKELNKDNRFLHTKYAPNR
jgi:uncharacterized protein YydD (DUF2326 family)